MADNSTQDAILQQQSLLPETQLLSIEGLLLWHLPRRPRENKERKTAEEATETLGKEAHAGTTA